MSNDSRILIYLSIMTLVLSCVVLGYGLVFYGWGYSVNLKGNSLSPAFIIIMGIVIASLNGIASNVLSDKLATKMESLSSTLRVGIPLTVFIFTLIFSIILALMSN